MPHKWQMINKRKVKNHSTRLAFVTQFFISFFLNLFKFKKTFRLVDEWCSIWDLNFTSGKNIVCRCNLDLTAHPWKWFSVNSWWRYNMIWTAEDHLWSPPTIYFFYIYTVKNDLGQCTIYEKEVNFPHTKERENFGGSEQ